MIQSPLISWFRCQGLWFRQTIHDIYWLHVWAFKTKEIWVSTIRLCRTPQRPDQKQNRQMYLGKRRSNTKDSGTSSWWWNETSVLSILCWMHWEWAGFNSIAGAFQNVRVRLKLCVAVVCTLSMSLLTDCFRCINASLSWNLIAYSVRLQPVVLWCTTADVDKQYYAFETNWHDMQQKIIFTEKWLLDQGKMVIKD
jgi:hypothetical protein